MSPTSSAVDFLYCPAAPSEKLYKATRRANDLFERHQYTEAIVEYTKILQASNELNEDDCTEYLALILSNRSASYLKTFDYESAALDALKATELAPKWAKSLLKFDRFDQAIDAFKIAANRDSYLMGIRIIQLISGEDIALEKSVLNPIQSKLNELAAHMKNIIHVIVDIKTKNCILVDACWDIDGILKYVDEHGYAVVAAVVTHYHFDHIGGSPPPPYDTLPIKISGLSTLLKRMPHIKAYIHPSDIPYLQQTNPHIQDNRLVPSNTDLTDHLTVGHVHIEFIHTPGHTPGSQALLVNKSRLLVGDTLLCQGHCGRTDLPGGNRKAMENTLRNVLGSLDDRIIVYPGHDYGTTWSTIGIERENGCLGEDLVGFGMVV
ncbi:beta-lactamase-like protein [Blakeslea trispora]|nr:beta-lactamase-like protein [Blakeslea trispora]